MKPLIWTEKYSVGIKALDDQHKVIFNSINELIESKLIAPDSEVITRILSNMTSYFWEHLIMEENLMASHNYPHYETHKDDHLLFKRTIMELNLEKMKQISNVPEKLITFLCDWWSGHILLEDMKYKDFLNSKGIK